MEPQIITDILPDGRHNLNLPISAKRLTKGRTYKDLSTIMIVPTRGVIPCKAVQSWMNMMAPMNQKFFRIFVAKMEVGEAYTQAIEMILANPGLKDFKYILTVEEDNLMPADGLIKLYEGMNDYDVVGGLYWTKGEGGQPMIYGNPMGELNFVPQKPNTDNSIQECNGLGMGFTLFKMDIFKDPKLPKPFFKTIQEITPQGGAAFTQDLYFFNNLKKLGYRVACHTGVKVGHLDAENDIIW
jgi:hypothetical protein